VEPNGATCDPFGVLALAVAGFVVAFRNNVGGIADFARGVWEKISLAFRWLVQLFEQGGFSGAVREELNHAENRGLKDFLINVYLWVNRIRNFFAGIERLGVDGARQRHRLRRRLDRQHHRRAGLGHLGGGLHHQCSDPDRDGRLLGPRRRHHRRGLHHRWHHQR
jgi:hypothetical protein